MVKDLIQANVEVLDAVAAGGDELLGQLAGRRNNLARAEYDGLFAFVDALPIDMALEDHRWIKARAVNARDAVSAGGASFELRQLVRRMRRKHGAAATQGA